jgi:NADH-quinone oxidoreductase subunit L
MALTLKDNGHNVIMLYEKKEYTPVTSWLKGSYDELQHQTLEGQNLAIAPEDVLGITKAARKDLYQDSFNEAVFMRPGQKLTAGLVNTDYKVVDGLVRLVGWVIQISASTLRNIQNGYVRSYALIMVLGVIALIAAVWMVTL